MKWAIHILDARYRRLLGAAPGTAWWERHPANILATWSQINFVGHVCRDRLRR